MVCHYAHTRPARGQEFGDAVPDFSKKGIEMFGEFPTTIVPFMVDVAKLHPQSSCCSGSRAGADVFLGHRITVFLDHFAEVVGGHQFKIIARRFLPDLIRFHGQGGNRWFARAGDAGQGRPSYRFFDRTTCLFQCCGQPFRTIKA